jgi:hypothetical protein
MAQPQSLFRITVYAWRDADPEFEGPDWCNVYERYAETRHEAEGIGDELADRDLYGDWQQIWTEARRA